MSKSSKESSLTDVEVINKVVSGQSREAFAILYHRYHQKVMDKCMTLLKNRTQAEELTEDILTKAYEKLPGFKQQASFSTWLYSITYNHCIDFLRAKKKLHYPQWNSEQELEDIPDTEEIVEQVSYDNLLPLLEEIHPEEKALLLMKYTDNLSMKQIAQSLRITDTAAKMRLKRARTRLLYLYKKKYLE